MKAAGMFEFWPNKLGWFTVINCKPLKKKTSEKNHGPGNGEAQSTETPPEHIGENPP